MTRTRGCLMVAHGDAYRNLAHLCASYFKTYNPGVPVRLCTDAQVHGSMFDEVVILDDVWHRSKIDAMIDSPFDLTLYIDVDALAVLDVRDGFDVLETHDIALCHDQWRNHPLVAVDGRRVLPNAYPQYNSGLIFFRTSPKVVSFLKKWRDRVRSSGESRDRALRELTFEASLDIAVLPPEYNVGNSTTFAVHRDLTAPRVIHAARFYSDPTYASCPYPVLRYLGPRSYARFIEAVANDRYVRRAGPPPAYAKFGAGWSPVLRLVALKALHLLTERSARGLSFPTWLFPRDLNVI